MPNFSSNASADVPENGLIEATCNRGHRTATIIQQMKFEILAEMGMRAIVKRSYREAVSSFATSLERLYEFFIEASCRKHGISAEAFSATWKQMAKQSERQLGAFCAAFLFETGSVAALMPTKQTEFRNAVIHKGILPSKDEAIKYGKCVFDCAYSVLDVLHSEEYTEIIRTLVSDNIRKRLTPAQEAKIPFAVMTISTPLSLAITDQPKDFEAILERYSSRPDFG